MYTTLVQCNGKEYNESIFIVYNLHAKQVILFLDFFRIPTQTMKA